MILQKPILRNQTVVLDARPEVHVEEEPVADESEEASVETGVEEATENTPETIETTEAAEEESPEESAEEKNALQKQRDQNIKDIDQNTLKVYDRVIEHRGGLAVVQLQGSACGGCGAHIPPQTVSEVRANSAVHTCGVCGRFLYYNKV